VNRTLVTTVPASAWRVGGFERRHPFDSMPVCTEFSEDLAAGS